MATKIKTSGDTSVNWRTLNPILGSTEIGVELDTGLFKVGDAVHRWNDLDHAIEAVDLTEIEARVGAVETGVTDIQGDHINLTTDQTIAGVKTFTASPVVPEPTTDSQTATRKFVVDQAAHAHSATILGDDEFTHTDSGDLYPTGWSVMAFSSPDATTWPVAGSGFIVNEKFNSGRFVQTAYQWWSTTPLLQFRRQWHITNGWSAWVDTTAPTGAWASPAKLATGDWNSYIESGVYRGNNLTNKAPHHGLTWEYVQIIKHTDSYILQVSFGYAANGGRAGSVYHRRRDNGTWTPWSPLDVGRDDGWKTPTFENGWTHTTGTFGNVGFRKLSSGLVTVRGLADNTASNTFPSTVFTLPVGWRPVHPHVFSSRMSGAKSFELRVQASGAVVAENVDGSFSPHSNWYSLACTFLAEQ